MPARVGAKPDAFAPSGRRVPERHDAIDDLLTAGPRSRIDRYDVVVADQLAYSVVEFRQTLSVGEVTAWFDCIATIVWKHTDSGWREARWHCSVIESDVPAELQPGA